MSVRIIAPADVPEEVREAIKKALGEVEEMDNESENCLFDIKERAAGTIVAAMEDLEAMMDVKEMAAVFAHGIAELAEALDTIMEAEWE